MAGTWAPTTLLLFLLMSLCQSGDTKKEASLLQQWRGRRLEETGCQAGEYGDTSTCASCSDNTYSAAGAAVCSPCPHGSYTEGNNRAGQGACLADETILARTFVTIAGSASTSPLQGIPAFVDDADPTAARFNSPTGVAFDESSGTLFVSDNYAIRTVSLATGAVGTLAGEAGPGEDDGVVSLAGAALAAALLAFLRR